MSFGPLNVWMWSGSKVPVKGGRSYIVIHFVVRNFTNITEGITESQRFIHQRNPDNHTHTHTPHTLTQNLWLQMVYCITELIISIGRHFYKVYFICFHQLLNKKSFKKKGYHKQN
jgi:hypothetical protein